MVVRNKKFRILITDNFFSCRLIMMKLCTVIKHGNDHHFYGNCLIKLSKKCLKASFLERLMKEYE